MYSYVFAGQGIQKKGMGEKVFAEFPSIMKTVDDILGYSLEEVCLENPNQELSNTEYAQPAIFVINALDYLMETRKKDELPKFLAGHSLGEFNALQAAGILGFEEALKLVQERGKIMSKAYGGSMMAVCGATKSQIDDMICSQEKLKLIDIANINEPKQIVVAGMTEDILNAKIFFENNKLRCIKLNVSGAFHSRYMEEQNRIFSKILEEVNFNPTANITVVSSINGLPYQKNYLTLLKQQMINPVEWIKCIEYIISQDCYHIYQVGTGKVLENLNEKIKWNLAVTSKSPIDKLLNFSKE